MKTGLYVLIGAALAFCGCMSSKADKYYLLNPEPVDQRIQLTLHSVELPEYLEQSSLVRCIGENRMEFLEGHRWMGSFKEMLEDALEDGMKAGGARGVVLKIRRMAASDDGKFHVDIECRQGDKYSRIAFELPCDSTSPDSIVTAYRAAVAEILRKLAAI